MASSPQDCQSQEKQEKIEKVSQTRREWEKMTNAIGFWNRKR